MEIIKVRKQERKHIYVHDDLSNAAYHFKTTLNNRANVENSLTWPKKWYVLSLAFWPTGPLKR
jgi:hypothetical protein